MKLKNFLKVFSRNKGAATLLGILVISIISSMVFVQSVYGQNALHQIFETSQISDVFSEVPDAVNSSGTSTYNGVPETIKQESVPEISQPLTPAPAMPSPAQETTAAAATEVTAAPATPTAAPTAKPTKAPTAKPTKAPTDKQTAKQTTQAATTVAAAVTTAAQTAKQTTQAATTVAAAVTTAAQTAPPVSGSFDCGMASAVLDLANLQRTGKELCALSWNDSLAATAQIRAKEIVVSFSHTRPDGSAWSTAGSQMAENIAKGQSSSDSVMQSWMASEGHAANIMNSAYTQIGVACYCVDGTYYWVQEFS